MDKHELTKKNPAPVARCCLCFAAAILRGGSRPGVWSGGGLWTGRLHGASSGLCWFVLLVWWPLLLWWPVRCRSILLAWPILPPPLLAQWPVLLWRSILSWPLRRRTFPSRVPPSLAGDFNHATAASGPSTADLRQSKTALGTSSQASRSSSRARRTPSRASRSCNSTPCFIVADLVHSPKWLTSSPWLFARRISARAARRRGCCPSCHRHRIGR